MKKVEFEINGTPTQVTAHPLTRLLDVIRENCKLTGTKEGCGEGECGACSVFVNGRLVNSCLIPVCQVQNAKIETIESLGTADKLSTVQQAFIEHGGAQCGICTPGMLLAAQNLLNKNPNPTKEDIAESLSGNLCRCTGYMKIFDSVLAALKAERS